MSELNGSEKAALLLRSLTPEAVEAVLARLEPAQSQRLRDQLLQWEKSPPQEDYSDQVLREFDDLLRIATREVPAGPKIAGPPEWKPEKVLAKPSAVPLRVADPEPEDEEETDDPVAGLRRLHPQGLALALQGEHARTAALVLNCLETQQAGEVLKRMPPEQRREVSLQLGTSVKGGIELVRRIAGALIAKSRALGENADEPSGDARYKKMADTLRWLEKADRMEIIAALEQNDPENAARIKDFLYQFEDLLLIEDRSMQKLLAEIDSKSLALALKEAAESIREKVLNNLSKRAREALNEEMEFMGTVSSTQIRQAQKMVVEVIQRLDKAGELVMKQG